MPVSLGGSIKLGCHFPVPLVPYVVFQARIIGTGFYYILAGRHGAVAYGLRDNLPSGLPHGSRDDGDAPSKRLRETSELLTRILITKP